MNTKSICEQKIERLRSALSRLIGAESPEELREMEAVLRQSPAPAQDKADAIDAIHALLALEENSWEAGPPDVDAESLLSSTKERTAYFVLTAALGRLKESKPNDRSDADRRWAVTITEMEKVVAYFNTWVLEPSEA